VGDHEVGEFLEVNQAIFLGNRLDDTIKLASLN